MTDYQTDLEHAFRLADEADAITMHYYRAQDLVVTDKPDHTPVTQGDIKTEQRLSNIITQEFGEECLGEEGAKPGKGARVWVIDPIDGTKNFLRGLPIWGTLIALNENNETVVAMVSCPALGRRWWATKGQGAWTQDVDGTKRRIHVSAVSKLEDAFILYSTPLSRWDSVPGTSEAAVQKILTRVWRDRAPGDVINYMWMAEGAADICFMPFEKLWDIEAPKLIITEAGGSFWTNADATTPPDAERAIVVTNGPLEHAALNALGF